MVTTSVGRVLVIPLLPLLLLALGALHSSEAFPVDNYKAISTRRPSSWKIQVRPAARMAASSDSATGDPHVTPQHVVIAGAGIIGTSTAFYLARNHGIRCTLVDPTGRIAPAASGKAGGFLALDWNDYAPTGPLTRRSFALHQELANELGAESIQYRRLTCASISLEEDTSSSRRHNKPTGKKLAGIEWVENSLASGIRPLGGEDTIAQVHPRMLCERLWESTQLHSQNNSVLRKAKVVGAVHDAQGNFVGARLLGDDEETGGGGAAETVLEADALLYACGPWTAPKLVSGIKYHSLIVPTERVLNQCVFFSGSGDPEVYVRPDATAYCTGFPDPPIVVTERPGQEQVRPDTIATIRNSLREASKTVMPFLDSNNDSSSSSNRMVVEQACYLPTTNDGIPIMGALPRSNGCYISVGHTCWGILMGPASGESMADLIATGQTKRVDLQPFSPRRYRNRDYKRG